MLKKVLRKAVWLKNRLKKITFNQKNAQQSFFGQKSSHKREGSKKYSKWGNSLEIYIETLCDRQTSGMTRCYWTHQQKLWWFHNILVGKVESERSHIHVWVHKRERLGDFSISLLTCLCIGLGQIWNWICRLWFAASWISLSPDSDHILLFCRSE